MSRLPDWKPRLTAWLTANARRPLVAGEWDCALFAAGAVEAMTGIDHAAGWRGSYQTLPAGVRALRQEGFADHVVLVAGLFEEVHPAFAQVGDIAVLDGDDDLPALGLVQGELVYVLRPEGIGTVPLTSARRIFRV